MRPWGQTPVVRGHLTRDHLSAISGVTPDGPLLLQVQERALRSPDVVRFLTHLLSHLPGKLLVIWDGAPLHRGQPVKAFLARGRRFILPTRTGPQKWMSEPARSRPVTGPDTSRA